MACELRRIQNARCNDEKMEESYFCDMSVFTGKNIQQHNQCDTLPTVKSCLFSIIWTCYTSSASDMMLFMYTKRSRFREHFKRPHRLCNNLLTPWCRVLLEKLTGLQLVKKFPAFLWNPKVHYRTHKRPPSVPILGQPNPAHITTSHLLEIHPNIIHPSTPRPPQWSLSVRFPHQDPIRHHLLTHTSHMPSPSHSSRFYHPHNIG